MGKSSGSSASRLIPPACRDARHFLYTHRSCYTGVPRGAQVVPDSSMPVRYRFDGFVLDAAAHMLRRNDGAVLPLRPKSFATLAYLIEHRCRVVPRWELIEQIWSGVHVSEDVLVGCIADIRHTLGSSRNVIRTVPKTGYQFVAELQGEPPQARSQQRQSRFKWLPVTVAAVMLTGGLAAWRYWPRPPVEVGWWRFDEPISGRVRDSSPRGNQGRTVGLLTHTREAPSGHALEFSGNSHIAGDTHGVGFPRGDASFAITAWVRVSVIPKQHGPIFHFGSVGHSPRSNAHLFMTSSGALCFGWGDGYGTACGGEAVTDGKWHHVAATYNSQAKRLTIYVDAADYARQITDSPGQLGGGAPWMIGSFQTGGYPFVGWLSDVRLYRGNVTHPQIAALAGCTSPGAVRLRGGNGYFVPLYRATVEAPPAQPYSPGSFEYSGFGKGGAEFALPDGPCSLASLRGASLAADLRISSELYLPADTAAGPFFRARRVGPGDPLETGRSSGYWLRLDASGEVTLHSLAHPEDANAPPLAKALAPVPVHAKEWHRLEAEAHGAVLRAWVDSQPVSFSLGGRFSQAVPLDTSATENAAGILVQAPQRPTDAILVRSIAVVDADHPEAGRAQPQP